MTGSWGNPTYSTVRRRLPGRPAALANQSDVTVRVPLLVSTTSVIMYPSPQPRFAKPSMGDRLGRGPGVCGGSGEYRRFVQHTWVCHRAEAQCGDCGGVVVRRGKKRRPPRGWSPAEEAVTATAEFSSSTDSAAPSVRNARADGTATRRSTAARWSTGATHHPTSIDGPGTEGLAMLAQAGRWPR